MSTGTQRRALGAILGVAALVRLIWVAYAAREPLAFGDPFAYYGYGLQIADGAGYVSWVTGEATAFFPVGYPAMLASVFWLGDHLVVPRDLPTAAGLVQALLGVGSVWLVFVLARELFTTRVGLVAAAIAALYPNLVFYTATFQVENLFIPLALGALAVILTHRFEDGPPSGWRMAAFGAVLGLSALVRPFALPFLPLLAVVWLARGFGWRRFARDGAIALVAVIAVIAPWTVRNWVVLDAPVLISTNMGDTLCLDRTDDATGRFRFPPECFEGYEDVAPEDIEERRNVENTRRAVEWVIENPAAELRNIVRRAWFILEHDHDGLQVVESSGEDPFLPDALRTALRVTADAAYLAVLVAAAVAVPTFARWSRPERLYFLAAGGSLLLIAVLLWGTPRFHVPALPFAIVMAAVTVDRFVVTRFTDRKLTLS